MTGVFVQSVARILCDTLQFENCRKQGNVNKVVVVVVVVVLGKKEKENSSSRNRNLLV